MGVTDCGPLLSQLRDSENWAHLNFSPALGSKFCHATDGLDEHFIVRNSKTIKNQAIFETFPDTDQWPLRDLYSRRPAREDHWLHRRRANDIGVLSIAQKLNPAPVEGIINANPAVSAALVLGTDLPWPCLLVEAIAPSTNAGKRVRQLGNVWGSVEAANECIPGQVIGQSQRRNTTA
ncbi:NRPS-like enzyme [Fusarium heterosporum]|uniref:NRPS-like enzyme n=1 Tax=Fusarium heterosporum TaxID=42747 RepID=A0A8H5SWV7_FUSHE|nr:NRPS-like enzyme [Fusarium heterosporum]